MENLQNILITVILLSFLFLSLTALANTFIGFYYDRKREKRELAQAERDKEYHEKRMENLLNK